MRVLTVAADSQCPAIGLIERPEVLFRAAPVALDFEDAAEIEVQAGAPRQVHVGSQ